MIFLATTGCLRARSARLFVLSTSGFLQPETNYPLVLADFSQTPSSDATYTVVLVNSASAPHTFSVRDEFSKIDFRLGASYERAFIVESEGKEEVCIYGRRSMRKAVKTVIGISRWVKERREKRRAEMQTAIKLRKSQLEKKMAEILRKKEHAYQQLLEYCQKGDVINQRSAAKRCIIFDKYIRQYKVGIEVLDITLLVLETAELNSELKQRLSEIIKLTSIDVPSEKFIAAMQEFREKMEKMLGAHEEIAEVLEPSVESAEVESYIARARAEVSAPKAKIKLEEKEESPA